MAEKFDIKKLMGGLTTLNNESKIRCFKYCMIFSFLSFFL